MFKEFRFEFVLAVVLSAAFFLAAEAVGDFVAVSSGAEFTFSVGLLAMALAIMVLPSFLAAVPSGFLVAKKTRDIKAVLFVPALGVAVGAFLVLLVSLVFMLVMPDSAWMMQMEELAEYDIGLFGEMSLAEYKSMVVASTLFGAVFMAILNFAIGLAGSFAGSLAAKKN